MAERTAKLSIANEELHRQKEQLDRLFELSPLAVILTDQNFQVLRVNQEFTRMFGYQPEEAVGRPLIELIVPEEFRPDSLTNMAVVLSGERLNLESVRRRKDGGLLDVSITGATLSLGSGETAIYLIYRDITEHKRAERELRRSEGYLAEAQRLSHTGSFGWSIPSGEIFWSEETFQIFQYDPTTKPTVELVLRRVYPEDAALVKDTIERASQSGKDFEHEYRLLMPDGSIKYVHAVAYASRQKSGGIEFVGAVSDVTPRRQAEQALRKSEERWRSVFENSAIGVALTGLNGRFLATNHVFQTMVGYAEEELRALSFLDITHEDYRAGNWALVTELLEGKRQQFQIEKKYLRKDGSSIWVRNNVSLVPGTENVPRFIMTLAEDVTERKRVEEALQRSEAYLAEGQRLAKTGSWAYNPNAERSIYWSEEMRRIFGLDSQTSTLPDREEFLRLVHPEDRDRFNGQIDKAFGEKGYFALDYRIVLPDGTVKHIHGIGHPVLDEAGKIVEYIGTDVDVTERKQTEEALRRSEGYLAGAERLSHTGSWAAQVPRGAVQVPQLKLVYWSEEMYRIFGFDPGPTPPSPMERTNRLYPEDIPHHHAIVEQAIRDRTDFEEDYRLLLPNGSTKYIHAVGHPIVDASGELIELVGTAMDVTAQQEARAALQNAFEQIKAEQTELQRMTDAIAAYIYVLHPDGTALYANQTALNYTGLTLEDVQAKEHRVQIFHPDDVERLEKERNEALARGVPFENEQRALGKDGKYRWFLVRYNPLRDDHGNVIRWYATGTDIEDRKQVEEKMRNENLALREQIDQTSMFEEIVGASPALQAVLSNLMKVAPTDSTVLITGETGTGKELLARAIHKRSQRCGQPFISVNCAAIPPSLIASELFGHEKGAFTGALQRRQGRFELANSGTIFLDEIGDLPAEAQIALLRVLQERQFERVGGTQTLTTDVRVITATNRDLSAAVAAGTFRADLFYRLNVFPLEVPPLRQRKEDIGTLVEYFVKRYAEKIGKHIRKIEKSTLELCHSYHWPGNIRELQNVVERSVILCNSDTFWIDEAWFPIPESVRLGLPGPLAETLQNQEREIIEAALAESRGKVAGPNGAAAKLGIPRSTLDWKIKQLKIAKQKFVSET